jgi:hypothetical protein
LAAKIEGLYRDRKSLARLSRAARARVENAFSIDTTLSFDAGLYDRLAGHSM